MRIAAFALGALDAFFLSVFALNAFTPEVPLGEQLIGFGMHLIPTIVFMALIATAWRFPIAGGCALILAAAVPFVALSNPSSVNLILSLPVLAAQLVRLECLATVADTSSGLKALPAIVAATAFYSREPRLARCTPNAKSQSWVVSRDVV